MSRVTRSTYSVTELGPDGSPVRSYNAVITPYYAGEAPGTPPGIWGPTDPRPENPIPIYPGGTPNPPGIWGPTDPRPTNPISGIPGLPGYEPPPIDPPTNPPDSNGWLKPPPEDGGWGYHEDHGWVYKPGAGSPSPKR